MDDLQTAAAVSKQSVQGSEEPQKKHRPCRTAVKPPFSSRIARATPGSLASPVRQSTLAQTACGGLDEQKMKNTQGAPQDVASRCSKSALRSQFV